MNSLFNMISLRFLKVIHIMMKHLHILFIYSSLLSVSAQLIFLICLLLNILSSMYRQLFFLIVKTITFQGWHEFQGYFSEDSKDYRSNWSLFGQKKLIVIWTKKVSFFTRKKFLRQKRRVQTSHWYPRKLYTDIYILIYIIMRYILTGKTCIGCLRG